ncbi:ATP-dependent DNA helicase RecG [Solemya velum gill symbiont]|uniref:ATP-dependent DNA helicase RecG n=1 Tax=Solemya velum gill symbiont TaxID=2340 RepID=UPI0009967BD2|nr:ATP-dependent DNA helicase RecG [Solemya velum gill symbiont]OOZ16195.1 ATP-dependent DNA helicase RecG [Solemya velum gill symbiont]OOZ20645.1 ATP-dependent DNA helicase RecG [Solemya velum gill symbiont]OOZ23181.1 ATP-dependent DNA helicase RecG [Solemya velum gill symbiont]OOZ24108.1 ATP-dependent DNA helicase RecG [Solemya velum gill symbiont]OOZ30305.1 ATP-dependent DNA helicase RecG [Solemya velum gill symbiont]
MQALDKQPVTTLKSIGPRSAERLASIGIETVEDVLFHLPFRYQDRTRVTPIGSGRHGDHLVIDARVDNAHVHYGRRRSLLVQVSDGSGRLLLRFFHFSNSQKNGFSKGARISCFGEVRRGPNSLELIHPEYRLLSEDHAFEVEESLTPIYPTTEGMQQQSWRDLTDKALALMEAGGALRELLPDSLLPTTTAISLANAIRTLHRPPPDTAVRQIEAGEHPAQQRLVFEELIGHQLSLLKLRRQQKSQNAFSISHTGKLAATLYQQIPFRLTAAQQRVLQEIESDLQQKHPMQRLIQGDVGSGKTIVAAFAALQAIEAGYQVAVMAPTELLAEQHRKNFETWLEPLGIQQAWLTSRLKGKKREAVLEQIISGGVQIIIGTHALFQKDVEFKKLALVIVDEQHRFGVHQRLALREKGNSGGKVPHQLIMTATPIPRTLAMTAYADLDLSVIDELPPGRTPVKTVLVSDQRRDEIVDRVALACSRGRQAYWVCTLIEESESLQAQAAEETANQLSQELEGIRVGLVHGRLKAEQKELVMSAFKAGEIDLLVATTVIEVGVDVPNASLMIIENPERLGLAQLHQLRGRVGRGQQQSHCALLYKSPLGETAKQRLAVMRDTTDGFEIARKDLEIRGPGEVLGTRQTGEMEFRVADVVRDQKLLPQVQQVAQQILDKHPRAAEALIARWVGQREKYGSV